MGEILEGFDGTHGWSVNPMTGPVLKADKELEQTKLDADFYGELRDPKLYTDDEDAGEDDVRRPRRATRCSLKRIDGVEDIDFYDVATGLRAGGTEHARSRRWGRFRSRASRATTRSSASSRSRCR